MPQTPPSPRRGEGWGEGVRAYRESVTPHPTPLPMGEGAGSMCGTASDILELRDHLIGDRLRLHARGVVGMLSRPYAFLQPFDCERRANEYLVRHVEARSPELADPRFDVRHVAELCRKSERRLRADQRNPDDTVDLRQVLMRHAQGRLEHQPGAAVEELEEFRVEYDARRVAVPPLDLETPAEDKIAHGRAESRSRSLKR